MIAHGLAGFAIGAALTFLLCSDGRCADRSTPVNDLPVWKVAICPSERARFDCDDVDQPRLLVRQGCEAFRDHLQMLFPQLYLRCLPDLDAVATARGL